MPDQIPGPSPAARTPATARHASRIATITTAAAGAAWASGLMIAGLHAIRLGLEGAAASALLVWIGLAGVAAGNFVFAVLTADSLFRPSPRRLPDVFVVAAAFVLVCALSVAAAAWSADLLP